MSNSFSKIVPGALQQPHVALLTAMAVSGAIIVTVLSPVLFSSRRATGIHELGGLSILTAWPFFQRRYDFLKSNFAKTGEKMFSFKVLHHSVTALRGEDARKAFFDNKSLSFFEGYKILMGAAPLLSDIDKTTEHSGDVAWSNKQIAIVLRRDRLADVIPTLFDDVQRRMEGWGKEGRMDPFKNIYDLVFQMTVRMATCHELASDLAVVSKVQHDYWMLQKSATPTTLLLPWLPSKAKKNKETATMSLYATLLNYVGMRRTAKVPSSDAIDVLLAQGLNTELVIGFVLGVIFAGVINTGINSCWALLFLSFHKEWKAKVAAEVRTLIETHTNSSNDPLHKRLSMIPISAWEEEMPVMEVVIRETLRIVLNGTAIRRNILQDLDLKGKTIPNGSFLAYSFSDVHLNPDIYTNPTEFDPTRFAPGREEDKRQVFGYLGWGAGRHPCTGMKVAKLEMKMILALIVTGYEHDVVNSEGKLPERLPVPDYNDIHQQRPVGDPCFIQFKRIVD